MNLLHLNTALALSLALSVFIPLVSAAIKWPKLPVSLVGVLTLVVTALNGFLTEWANSSDSGHYDWKTALGISLYSLFIAIAAHYGFWKQTPITDNLMDLGDARKKRARQQANLPDTKAA